MAQFVLTFTCWPSVFSTTAALESSVDLRARTTVFTRARLTFVVLCEKRGEIILHIFKKAVKH